MAARTFTFQQGTSDKFWTIEVSGTEHTVHYGRIGTAGQVKTKAFADEAKATASAEKLIAEKLAKGYVEEGTATPPPAARACRRPPAPRLPRRRAPAAPLRPPPPPSLRPPCRPRLAPHRRRRSAPTSGPAPPGARSPSRPASRSEFDRARAAAAMRKARTVDYGWNWSWRDAPFTGRAHARGGGRLAAAHQQARARGARPRSAQADGRLRPGRRRTRTETPQLAASARACRSRSRSPRWSTCSAPRRRRVAARARVRHPSRWHGDADERRPDLALGVRAFLLPRLEPADRERFTAAVADWLDRSPPAGTRARRVVPVDARHPARPLRPAALDRRHLARDAARGDYYHSRRRRSSSGSSPPTRSARRSSASAPAHVRELARSSRWLAHTETERARRRRRPDRRRRQQATRRGSCSRTLATRVHDPAAAPVMLELARNSKAQAHRPRVARRAPARGGRRPRPHARRPRPPRGRRVPARPQARRRRPRRRAAVPRGPGARSRTLVLEHEDADRRELTRDELPPPLAAALADRPRKQLPRLGVEAAALPPIVIGDGRLGAEDVDARPARLRQLKPDEPASPRSASSRARGHRARSPGACSRPGWPRARRARTSGRCSRSARSAATRRRPSSRR